MLELWKKKFIAAQYCVKYHNPRVFVLSQWQTSSSKPSSLYLVYRWAITIFFIVSWVLSIIDISHLNKPNFNKTKWLIFLTNWGFTMCTIQSILSTTMATICYALHDSETSKCQDHKILRLYKVYWVTNVIATDLAFGITIIYWSLIYKAGYTPNDAMNIIVHGFNSILMFIELCVVMHPIRIAHFYWPVLFGIAYIFFTIIYYFAGGTGKEDTPAIYPILDWSKAEMTTIVCVLVCFFVVILHLATYCIYKLRKAAYRKWFGGKNEQITVDLGRDNPIPVLSNDLV